MIWRVHKGKDPTFLIIGDGFDLKSRTLVNRCQVVSGQILISGPIPGGAASGGQCGSA